MPGAPLPAGAAELLVLPGYAATEGAADSATPPDVRSLGEEVVASLRVSLPPAAFAAAFAACRDGAAARRLKRRSERALEAVVDAGASARRREARAGKKKQHKAQLALERKAHKARGTVAPAVLAKRAAKRTKRSGRAEDGEGFT